jgi:hypothetical protein
MGPHCSSAETQVCHRSYIIAARIQSTVRLFADDAIAYVTISSDADAANLQQDLDKLAEWESK